jgi:hypothetical protein
MWLRGHALVVGVLLLWCLQAAARSDIPQWTRFAAQFTSAAEYDNPVQDVQVEVEFTSASGKSQTVLAFWDGGKVWKVRFSPADTGKWTYRTRCSREADTGLNNQAGEFICVPYTGTNLLYRHGALRVSDNRRYLVHADGTPFFWLSDTAWNGALKSDAQSWARYLTDRASKGFTGVQFVTTQWLAAAGNADLRLAYLGRERIWIDPVFYQWMDERIDALNAHGLVAAPVPIWAAHWNKRTLDLNPGTSLPDDQIILLVRYLVARYGAHQVIWILAGDSDYRGERAERWKKIGRAVFGAQPSRLATMHPAGQEWVADEFRHEPWFSFNGYQSGHGDSDEAMRWLVEGPPSQDWKTEPHHPIINLEPNYEGHKGYTHRKPFDAHAVRRAAYWSLLVSPPAGVSYGGHGIWSWELKSNEPMNHPGTGVSPPWQEAIRLPGSTSMKHLKTLFTSLAWWRLRPAPELLMEQPGANDPSRFVAVAKAEDGAWALAYLPAGGSIALRTEQLANVGLARWFNPRAGTWHSSVAVTQNPTRFTAPDAEDWVLWIGPKPAPTGARR